MNINSNELLLLNKKIKFAGEAGKPAADVTVPAPETNTPQTGLNALMFQGLNNVVSDPQLAGELKIMSEANTEKTEDKAANEYIAPYKSNLAFQGKASKFKSIALAALMGLATLGATSTLTSCDDKEYIGIPGSNTNNVTINIDFDKITAMFQQMQEMWQQMLEQQQITNEQLQQNNEFMKQLLQMYQEGMADANEFYEQMYNFIMSSTANQEIIIGLLEQNGMSQEEANNLLRELIAEVQAGNLSAAEAMDKIMDLLGDIKGLLSQAISDFNKFYEEMLAKQDELIETNKQGFDELINQGNITNATLEDMKAQNDSLIVLSNKQIEAQNEIKEAIEKANLDSNANFDKVVETLNVNKNELIEALEKLGYSQEEIIKMTASQIINAIDNNTAVTEGTNNLLTIITEQLTDILPKLLEQGKITNEQLNDLKQQMQDLMNEVQNGNISADEFYNKAFEYMAGSAANQQVIIAQLVENGKTQQEANNLIKQLISDVQSGNKTAEAAFNEIKELLGNIDETLGEISQVLKDLLSDFDSFYNDYKNDKDKEFHLLDQLIQNGKLQTSILQSMNNTINSMSENITGIKTNTDKLLEIAQDDTKFNELIEAIKNIQAGGSADIDYQRLEDMFKMMGLTITDAINMSSSQLEQAIKDFQNTYVNVEQKQIEELQTIQSKIDDLQMFLSNNDNNQEIIDAINNITVAIGNGNEDVTNELKNLTEQLNKLQQAIDAIYKAIGDQAAITNTYFAKWDGKFDSMLGSLVNLEGAANDIKSQLSTIIANQKTTQVYLDNLLEAIAELKEEIIKLQDSTDGEGSSITLEQLEELWKQHDEANFNKYKELIENLDLNVDIDTSTIEDLLTSIDNKMEYINDNSEILTQILNKLNSIDWSNPDYTDKLDKIIEILENFKCNCDCGGNNEGILGDLDDVLG